MAVQVCKASQQTCKITNQQADLVYLSCFGVSGVEGGVGLTSRGGFASKVSQKNPVQNRLR
jgi:hypothetical protein